MFMTMNAVFKVRALYCQDLIPRGCVNGFGVILYT